MTSQWRRQTNPTYPENNGDDKYRIDTLTNGEDSQSRERAQYGDITLCDGNVMTVLYWPR